MNRILKLVAGKIGAPRSAVHTAAAHGREKAGGGAFQALLQRARLAESRTPGKAETVALAREGQAEVGRLRSEGTPGGPATAQGTLFAGVTAFARDARPVSDFLAREEARIGTEELAAPASSQDIGGLDRGGGLGQIPTSLSAFVLLSDSPPQDPVPADTAGQAGTAPQAVVMPRQPPMVGLADPPGGKSTERPSGLPEWENRLLADAAARRAMPQPAADAPDEEAPLPGAVVSIKRRETHFTPAVASIPPSAERQAFASERPLHGDDPRPVGPVLPPGTKVRSPPDAVLPSAEQPPSVPKPRARGEGLRQVASVAEAETEAQRLPDAGRPRPPSRLDTAARHESPGDDAAARSKSTGASPQPDGEAGVPLPVLQGIGAAIAGAADRLSATPVPGRAEAIAISAAVPRAGAPEPVRGIELRVDVPRHGALHMRLTLSGRNLTIRLGSEDEETVHRLRHSRTELSAILGRAGYDADIVTVQARPADAATSTTQPTSPDAQSNSGGNGGSAAQNQADRDRSRQGRGFAWTEAGPERAQGTDEPTAPHARAAGLYV